jgi:putative lipoprotein
MLLVVAMLAAGLACGGAAPDGPATEPGPASADEAPTAVGPPVGEWTLVAIDGVELAEGADVTMTIDADGRLSGSSGCNRYTTGATFEGASMSVGPIAGTRMACPEPQMDLETSYLGALESAATFAIEDDVLRFFAPDGAERLEFRRAADEDSAA